jgi:hypothetical protein
VYTGFRWGNQEEKITLKAQSYMGGEFLDGSSGSGMRDMDWIDLAQDRGRWRAIVKAVMNLRVP